MQTLKEKYQHDRKHLIENTDKQEEALKKNFAIMYAQENQYVAVSGMQRCFLIGYNEACRRVEWLEANSYILPIDENHKRKSNLYEKET